MIFRNITGIILAGGKSTRIGVNKSLLNFGDKTFIEIISDTLTEIFSRVIIISDERNTYEFLSLEIYPDIFKNKGPLSGIHSGLVNSDTERNFIISCDMPLISNKLIKFISEFQSDKDIIVTSAENSIQPLCGIYSKSVITVIEEILTDDIKKNYSVKRLLDISDTEIIDITESEIYNRNTFLNINKKQDYQYIKSLTLL